MKIKKYLTLGTIVMSCNILIPANPGSPLDSRHTQAIHVTPEVSQAQGEEIDMYPWQSDLREVEYKMFGNMPPNGLRVDMKLGAPGARFSSQVYYALLSGRMKELRCTLTLGSNRVSLGDLRWIGQMGDTELMSNGSHWYSAIVIQAYGIAVILPDDNLFLIPMSACKELDQLVKQIERDPGISTPQDPLDKSEEVAQKGEWERVD